jgi:hypothetical protein
VSGDPQTQPELLDELISWQGWRMASDKRLEMLTAERTDLEKKMRFVVNETIKTADRSQ